MTIIDLLDNLLAVAIFALFIILTITLFIIWPMNVYRVTFANGICITAHCNNQWSAREQAKRKYAMQYGQKVREDERIPAISNVILIINNI